MFHDDHPPIVRLIGECISELDPPGERPTMYSFELQDRTAYLVVARNGEAPPVYIKTGPAPEVNAPQAGLITLRKEAKATRKLGVKELKEQVQELEVRLSHIYPKAIGNIRSRVPVHSDDPAPMLAIRTVKLLAWIKMLEAAIAEHASRVDQVITDAHLAR